MSLVLALATALLFSLGTWLVLQRRLSRLIIGLGLLGHGANLLLMMGDVGDKGERLAGESVRGIQYWAGE